MFYRCAIYVLSFQKRLVSKLPIRFWDKIPYPNGLKHSKDINIKNILFFAPMGDDIIHDGEYLFDGFGAKEGYAGLLEIRQAFEDRGSCEMTAGVDDALAFVVATPLNGSKDVLFEDGDFVGHREGDNPPLICSTTVHRTLDRAELFTPQGRERRIQCGFHFGEEPWVAEGGASDHNGIHAVSVEALFRPLGRTHVPVTYNRYMHARVVLHFSDEGPVRFAFVHLRARATVDSKFGDAAILKGFSQIDDKKPLPCPPLKGGSIDAQRIDAGMEVGFVPSEAGLGGNGCMYGIDDGTGDLQHFGYVL